MIVTEFTKNAMHYRRTRRKWLAEGFEPVDEAGGRLWEIHRGGRSGQIITDVRIAPGGKELFVKIGEARQ